MVLGDQDTRGHQQRGLSETERLKSSSYWARARAEEDRETEEEDEEEGWEEEGASHDLDLEQLYTN